MAKTVKARIHHGADSLDITIPVEIVREHDINEGDIFKIKVNEKDENLVLSYERVYESEEK